MDPSPGSPGPRARNAMRALRLTKSPLLKQAELAHRVGCTQSDISAYELGSVVPQLDRAVKIALALGSTVEAVFFGLADAAQQRMDALLRQPAAAADPAPAPDTA